MRTYNNWFRAVNMHSADEQTGCTLQDICDELKHRYGYKVRLKNGLIPAGACEMSDAVGYSMDVCLNLLATTAALTLFDLDRSSGTVDRVMRAFNYQIKQYKAGDQDYHWITDELRERYHLFYSLKYYERRPNELSRHRSEMPFLRQDLQ